MPTLIACLSTGKGTWAEVNRLLQVNNWTKVFLITNKFGEDTFKNKPECVSLIVLDLENLSLSKLTEQIKSALKDKISDFEIGLNLASGSGKEHMAVLEAILELGLNFRLVSITQNGQMEVLGMKAN